MPAATTLRRHTLIIGLLLTLAPALACASDGNPPNRLPTSTVTAKVDGLRLGDLAWLRRDSFGLDSATLARYRELGRTRFLDQQLAGDDDSLPPQVAAQISQLSVISTPLPQQLAEYQERAQQFKQVPAGPAKDDAKKAFQLYRRDIYQQAAQAEMLHAIYGGDQLKEQLVWFWLNHFSIYADKGPVRLFTADYEENVIPACVGQVQGSGDGHAAKPGHAGLPRQRAQRQGQDQRELRA